MGTVAISRAGNCQLVQLNLGEVLKRILSSMFVVVHFGGGGSPAFPAECRCRFCDFAAMSGKSGKKNNSLKLIIGW